MKGKINKGIRNTILNEPSMFFAYNNGIAANNFNFGAAASTAFLVIIVVLALIYISATEKAEEGIY